MIIFLQIADFYITYKVLGKGGKEKNPIVKFIMDKIGKLPTLLLFKTAAIGGCGFIYLTQPYLLVPIIVWYGVVVFKNFKEMQK